RDAQWNRTSIGVGSLTTDEVVDPNWGRCNWKLPPGSVDPYAIQFKAVASLGDGCPTLDLPYATPLNMVTDAQGLPIDASGKVVASVHNPTGVLQFKAAYGYVDIFDTSYLADTRLRPMPHSGSTR